MTLTEFLLARIAEDETWLAPPTAKRMIGRKMVEVPIARIPSYVEKDRTRWAAECEAKRRIVAHHRPANLEDDGTPDTYADEEDGRYCWGCHFNGVEEWCELLDECPTKRALALPYVDHPDYLPEWRP